MARPKSVEQVFDVVENLGLYYEYEYVGIRTQDKIPFSVGSLEHNSFSWEDGIFF